MLAATAARRIPARGRRFPVSIERKSTRIINDTRNSTVFVHKALSRPEVQEYEGAQLALKKEWDKLKDKDAWDYDSVRERADVEEEARRTGVMIHLGSLMAFCHIKNYQLGEDQWSFKGRVVFRGDNVKDENGQFAVFSEQGANASHLMAARMVDAVAHMPGMGGEDSDATGAYTQIYLGKDCPQTWIELPRDQWHDSWRGKYTRPVVVLKRNLYGHPLAGLYWFLHCEKQVQRCGFEKVNGWECLYTHKQEGLILSIYVDDFKMGGRREAIPRMWKLLKTKGQLELDPPVPSSSNVYLECANHHVNVPKELIEEKRNFFWQIMKMSDPLQTIAPKRTMTSNNDDERLPGFNGSRRVASRLPRSPITRSIPSRGSRFPRRSQRGIKIH